MGKTEIISNDHFVIQRLEDNFHQGSLLPQLLDDAVLTNKENIQLVCVIVSRPRKENEWKKRELGSRKRLVNRSADRLREDSGHSKRNSDKFSAISLGIQTDAKPTAPYPPAHVPSSPPKVNDPPPAKT